MKLQSLNSFEVLNQETVSVITGGNASIAYDCSKKTHVDSEHHDSAADSIF